MALTRRHVMRFVGLVILLIFTAFFFVPIDLAVPRPDQDRRPALD